MKLNVRTFTDDGAAIGNVEATVTALVLLPENQENVCSYMRSRQIAYIEGICQSAITMHAVLASISDDRITTKWALDGASAIPPNNPHKANVKVLVRGMQHPAHHFAILSQDAKLVMDTGDPSALWRALRARVSAPAAQEWGEHLLPRALDAGVLQRCTVVGLPDDWNVYILSMESESQFDALVSQHVRRHGFPKRGGVR
jgi:hypothetical protein